MPDSPPHLRQWTLLRSLSVRRQGATLHELAEDHGVNQKAIHRDLLLLRHLGFLLVYETGDHGRKHWRLDGKIGLAQFSFTLEEAAALYLGRHYSHNGQLIDDLVRAIEDRRMTVITYQSLRSTEPVTRMCDALQLNRFQ